MLLKRDASTCVFLEMFEVLKSLYKVQKQPLEGVQ